MNAAAIYRSVQRALRCAVAVALTALLGAILWPQSEGERFASVAYVAAIFAASMLAIAHFVPRPERLPAERLTLSSALRFVTLVAIALFAAAVLAPQTSGAVVLLVCGAALVVVDAYVLTGIFADARARLSAGGANLAATRAAVLFAVAAFALSQALPDAVREVVVRLGYLAIVVATLLVFASKLERPVRAPRKARTVDWASQIAAVELLIRRATLVAVAAMVAAGFGGPFGGFFSVAGYVALVVATIGIVVKTQYSLRRNGSANA